MKIAERMAQVSPSATLKLTSKAKEMKARGLPIISFGAGEPDFDTPDAVKEAGAKALRDGFTKYTPTSGTPELREAVCSVHGLAPGLLDAVTEIAKDPFHVEGRLPAGAQSVSGRRVRRAFRRNLRAMG